MPSLSVHHSSDINNYRMGIVVTTVPNKRSSETQLTFI
jgi:hypothetical protein